MKVKTSELTSVAFDWAVAKGEDRLTSDPFRNDAVTVIGYQLLCRDANTMEVPWEPSCDWAQGGPIIERERIELHYSNLWGCWTSPDKRNAAIEFVGSTPLIAAMRCYVASKLGDVVDVPEHLV